MRRIGYAAFALVLLADLASKQWILSFFNQHPARTVEILPVFNLSLVLNKGVSFGLFSDGGETGKYVLSSIGIVASIILLWMIKTSLTKWAILGYGLIAGGALGNALDRLWHGGVVDFIDAHVAAWHFWTFNFADAAITIGVICLLIDMFVQDKTDV